MSLETPNNTGQVYYGDIEYDGRVILYIIKADQTSYINYIKPIILVEELRIPHVLSVIDTKEEWYRRIHPERYVPALRDVDSESGEESIVFEGTACIQYLAEKFDVDGLWRGRTHAEKAAVLTWTAYQTAGLGATAKYWLYFSKGYPNRQNPEPLPKTVAKLHANVLAQWDLLDQRLTPESQNYIALPDRPTLADISYFPFAMPWMFTFLGVDIHSWPNIQSWAMRMLEREAVKKILERGPTYGHQ
ncbi:glutathione S-transferase [Amylocarpus encephaloides]|uniref:glutathione transferase n=1 Tax=Amylocarpus encephaloides TaxID=45428 RepID=A0A9P7YC41_9HELO|nr:glutathione S-transferase [Amylocarpus encephaloides]